MQDTDNFDSKQWLKVYIDELEWHRDVNKKLVEVIEYVMQEIANLRSDFDLMINALLLDKHITEDKLEALRQIANKNIKMLSDPKFIEQLQKGKASMGDIFERQAPEGSVKL